ncbi:MULTISPECIES: tail fiber domain-containing protein [Stenotrophomonas maltophilia group]|uniref:tail fiber domain-containing protein n=1 Tax=Stenotrophomonas maltophilia group TaxID=995085 RepID=UPI0011B7C036|nr:MULTISPECIES: tail fiber domain-containing protein [Stenotrophomonas maltophilia group]MCZ7843184.1 tail fiber domain-containing protein [Stenotrophomonas maltophilia]
MSTTPGYVSNAELASRLSTLVDRWNRRENQMIALLTQEEGTVVVTDGLGNNHTLPSFPQLQKDVAGLTDELTGSVVQVRDLVSVATGMANAAAESASEALGFSDAAEASAVRAAESAASIEDDVIASAEAAATAVAKAGEASASASAAATKAAEAGASAVDAAASSQAASASAASAGDSMSQARAAANAADASRAASAAVLVEMTDLADLVEADAQSAAASKTAAAGSATAAAASVTSATSQANRAEAQASIATTKASEAAGSAVTAAGHASAASGSASAASTSAQTASSAKTAAEAARDKANLYANAPQGTEVSPGEFSAKHWAAQAQSAATGSLVYMGSWDASTGAFPANPVKGHFYKVVGEGTVGDIHWRVGDQALYGVAWEKIDNTDQVTSVAGKQGDVTLVAGDIGGLGALATRNDVDFNTHVTGKPTTYPPSTHTHTKAQVGLDKVDNTADLDKPISTATQTALDGKAAASHSHTIANVTGLQAALDGKAAAPHSHAIPNVTGLQAALDAKANLSGANFTGPVGVGSAGDGNDLLTFNSERSWSFKQVGTAAETVLQLYDNTGAKRFQIAAAQTNNVIEIDPAKAAIKINGNAVWHSGTFNPASKADASHTHTIANVTGLQAALDGKASLGGATFTGQVTLAYAAPLRLTGMGAAGTVYIHGTNGAGDDVCSIARGNANSWYNLFWNGAANIAGRLTAGDQIYLNAGWFRSQQSGTGWYSEPHGGGWFMQDNMYIRSYGSKRVLISSGGGADGDLRLESTSPTITFYDTDHGTTHWLHCNDNNLGFLASNSFAWACFRNNNNDWQCQSNSISYASDARLKENIAPIARSAVDDFFTKFRVREFDWNDERINELNPGFTYSAKHEYGAIAQEVEEVLPYMVYESEHNGIKTILWDKAVPFLIAEVQALRKEVAELRGGA